MKKQNYYLVTENILSELLVTPDNPAQSNQIRLLSDSELKKLEVKNTSPLPVHVRF